jgi:tetratricopeptide (TPR) repeat protein
VRLNLYEEWCFDLSGLPVPDDAAAADIESYSAVQLFVQRARHIQHDFLLEANRAEVAQICRALGGIPLAIELAASWVRSYSCREIAGELGRSLDILTTNLRNVPERHRSMRAAFEHSWRLMADLERAAFAGLSVFHGGFDWPAAERVAGVTRATLRALIDASMLQLQPDGRYQLHELLRQFGAEKLAAGAPGDIRKRHSRFYAAYLAQREPHKLTAQEPAALRDIAVELENIRAGWQCAVDDLLNASRAGAALETISRYAPMLGYFFERRSRYREGLRLFRDAAANLAALAAQPAGAPEQPGRDMRLATLRVRLGEATFCLRTGEYGEAERLLKPSLSPPHQPSDPRVAAEALSMLGITCIRMGRYAEAERYLQASLDHYTALDDAPCRSAPLYGLGLLAFEQHEFGKARDCWQECLETFRATGYQLGIARALSNLASNTGRHGNYQDAKRLYEEALPIAETAGDEQLLAVVLSNLGSVSQLLADPGSAIRFYERSLEISRRISDRRWTAASLNGLALTLIETGHLSAARAHVFEALELSRITGNLPDALDSLSALGQILAADAWERAAAVLSLVVSHPITRRMARDESQQVLERLQERMPPDAWAAAFARGKQAARGDIMAFVAQQLSDRNPA